jgi:hypothetical protein
MIGETATAIACGLRSLDMEVLACLPCGGSRHEDNGRQVWDRGASIVEMQQDFMVSKAVMRACLGRLKKRWGVRTGNVAPVNLLNGGKVRGGHCAFVEPLAWLRVQKACEAYWTD